MGLNGGLLLGWMPKHNLQIQHSSKNMIHANLLDHKGTFLSITFFYGHPKLAKRKSGWNYCKLGKLLFQTGCA